MTWTPSLTIAAHIIHLHLCVCVCVCVFCSDRTAAVLPMTKSYTNWVTQLDVV